MRQRAGRHIGAAAQAGQFQRRAGGSRSAGVECAGRQKRKLWPRRACTAMATLSSAVKGLNTEVIWYERASPRRTRRSMGMRVTSTPSSSTRPPSGRSSPLNWPISVVLPAPLGPITA